MGIDGGRFNRLGADVVVMVVNRGTANDCFIESSRVELGDDGGSAAAMVV